MREHLKDYIESSGTAAVRGLRILLEYFYATEIFEGIQQKQIKVISVFGSARTKPNTEEYRYAYKLGRLLYQSGFAVVTGASRGVMQAANQGVADAIAQEVVRSGKSTSEKKARMTAAYRDRLKHHSVGLSISLPMESKNNPYVGVGAAFHYFMVRKFFFGTLSSGFIACEGGWGTRDELYEMMTLVQTGKAPLFPIVYVSPDARHLEQDIRHALKRKYISPADLHLIQLVKSPEQAVAIIRNFYHRVEEVRYDRDNNVLVVLKELPVLKIRKKVEQLIRKHYTGKFLCQWRDHSLFLTHYTPHSYGHLRQAIDLLNQS